MHLKGRTPACAEPVMGAGTHGKVGADNVKRKNDIGDFLVNLFLLESAFEKSEKRKKRNLPGHIFFLGAGYNFPPLWLFYIKEFQHMPSTNW